MKGGARLFPERKVKEFLDALVEKEHITVSDIEHTAKEHKVMIGGKAVIIAVRHHGEKGIKEPYINLIINAAAEKYGKQGTPEYDIGRKHLKALARQVMGY